MPSCPGTPPSVPAYEIDARNSHSWSPTCWPTPGKAQDWRDVAALSVIPTLTSAVSHYPPPFGLQVSSLWGWLAYAEPVEQSFEDKDKGSPGALSPPTPPSSNPQPVARTSAGSSAPSRCVRCGHGNGTRSCKRAIRERSHWDGGGMGARRVPPSTASHSLCTFRQGLAPVCLR